MGGRNAAEMLLLVLMKLEWVVLELLLVVLGVVGGGAELRHHRNASVFICVF